MSSRPASSFEDISRRVNADFASLSATERSLSARLRSVSLAPAIPIRIMKIVTVVLGAASMTATYTLWRTAEADAETKRMALRSLQDSMRRHNALVESANHAVRIDGAAIQTARADNDDVIRRSAAEAVASANTIVAEVNERRLRRIALVDAL